MSRIEDRLVSKISDNDCYKDVQRLSGIAKHLIAMGLTDREAAVALRIWEGDSISDAASQLRVSPNTVKTHLKRIFRKLMVHTQAALVRTIALRLSERLSAAGPEAAGNKKVLISDTFHAHSC